MHADHLRTLPAQGGPQPIRQKPTRLPWKRCTSRLRDRCPAQVERRLTITPPPFSASMAAKARLKRSGPSGWSPFLSGQPRWNRTATLALRRGPAMPAGHRARPDSNQWHDIGGEAGSQVTSQDRDPGWPLGSPSTLDERPNNTALSRWHLGPSVGLSQKYADM